MPIDINGRCVIANKVFTSGENQRNSAKEPPMEWECSSECKFFSDAKVYMIIHLAAAFQKPMRELRCALESVESGCPNYHSSSSPKPHEGIKMCIRICGQWLS